MCGEKRKSMKALLMLENGMTFEGQGFGDERDVVCEIVFNSAMCGYPELLTDPSYAGQGVVMTYPMIGNYGICIEDAESGKPWLSAFIVHNVSGLCSHFRRVRAIPVCKTITFPVCMGWIPVR